MHGKKAALARLRARRRSRGAAVFVVTLVMTLLGAMGIFAARAASMTQQAAGYDRLNEQTQYVAEHGALVAVAQMGRAPEMTKRALNGIDMANGGQFSQNSNKCRSGSWFPNIAGYSYACVPFTQKSLQDAMASAQQSTGYPQIPIISPATQSGAASHDSRIWLNEAGSLGPEPLNAHIRVELTDAGPIGRPIAGSNVGAGQKFTYKTASLAAWGQVGPDVLDPAVCTAADRRSARITARLVGRGSVVFGPIPEN